jgi:hypothetical protein
VVFLAPEAVAESAACVIPAITRAGPARSGERITERAGVAVNVVAAVAPALALGGGVPTDVRAEPAAPPQAAITAIATTAVSASTPIKGERERQNGRQLG